MAHPLLRAIALYLAGAAACIAQIRPEVSLAELVVESSPGAAVMLDGKPIGEVAADGRLVLQRVVPGEHTLRVELRGKRPLSRTVVLVGGKPNRIRAILADFTGSLEVFTTPDATVLVDGKPAGTADGAGRLVVRGLRAGTHTVRAGHAGFNSEEQTVDISADLVSTVTMELRRIEAVSPASAAAPPDYVMERKLTGHTGGDVVPVFRSNSMQLMSRTLAGDRVLRFWDPATGRELAKVELAFGYVIAAVSADLRMLAVTTPGRATGVIAILDSATGKEIRRMPQQAAETSNVAFSPDGARLVTTGRDGKATVWDTHTGAALHSWQDPANDKVAYSRDGRWIATGDEEVSLRDAESGAEVWRTKPLKRVTQLTFSPDSRWLAMVSQRVELRASATGKEGRTIEPPASNDVLSIVFTADSRFVGAAFSSAVRLWDIGTGEQVRAWPFTAWSTVVAFSPDGKWMATGENVKDTGLSIWRRKP